MTNNTVDSSYQKLLGTLEEIIRQYRSLLELVRKEKEILLSAQLDSLHENNVSKDQILMKIKLADLLREKQAKELALLVNADSQNPRLLDLALHMATAPADRLRVLHSTLDLLIRRLTEINRENEIYAQNAMKTLKGTLSEIKETLSGGKTYEKKGQYKLGPDQAGNFISKEA